MLCQYDFDFLRHCSWNNESKITTWCQEGDLRGKGVRVCKLGGHKRSWWKQEKEERDSWKWRERNHVLTWILGTSLFIQKDQAMKIDSMNERRCLSQRRHCMLAYWFLYRIIIPCYSVRKGFLIDSDRQEQQGACPGAWLFLFRDSGLYFFGSKVGKCIFRAVDATQSKVQVPPA